MTLLNRSAERAETLAADFPEVDFSIHLMPNLMECVAQSDVIFVASGSESILIHGQDLAGMPEATAAVGGVRRFFDISVPRNVASNVSDVDGAHVFNVDDLKEVPAAPAHLSLLPQSCRLSDSASSCSISINTYLPCFLGMGSL